jgi:hypothetical protein
MMYVEALFIDDFERSLISVYCSEMPVEGDVWSYNGHDMFRVWRVFKGAQSFKRCFNAVGIALYRA